MPIYYTFIDYAYSDNDHGDFVLYLDIKQGSYFNPSKAYSNDRVVAAWRPNFPLEVYDTIELATLSSSAKNHAWSSLPIFAIELENPPTIEKKFNIVTKQSSSHQVTTSSNFIKVISATHNGIIYDDLLETLQRREEFYEELQKLTESKISEPKLQENTDNLIKVIRSLAFEGADSYVKLTGIVKETSGLLKTLNDSSSTEEINAAIKVYKQLAQTTQGHPSIGMQLLGACMILLAAAVMTMGMGIIAGTIIGLTGFGFYAIGMRETGICKEMHNIAIHV
jgi:hypothetical protein